MVVVAGRKVACATCIKGHRSSSCNHMDRPLFLIRAKGRPVSQCEHCRELRKTKQVHVKCECDTKPAISAIPDPDGQLVVARKGARKVKTLENQKPIFPHGITSIEDGERQLAQMDVNEFAHDPGCACKDGGTCNCCTDRYIPKHARADSSTAGPSSSRPTHASRPSISLTIPHGSEGGPSSPTPTHARRGSRSHSRSPSRGHMHNTSEGHIIGGSPSDHRQHPMHYSPYPTVNGAFNQSPSSAVAASMSPAHLAPPGMDNPFAYSHDSSAPASPLSVDYDRPGSAISAHSGRNTPFDYSNLPGTPTHPQSGSSLFGSSDLGAVDAMRGMSLAAGNSSPHSATVGTVGHILGMDQRLSPVTAFNSYRQTQQDVPSPISPTTPQFLSPTESSAQTSPTSYAPLAPAFNPNLHSPVDPFTVPPGGPLDMGLMSANFTGSSQRYPDVFDGAELEPNDGVGMLFGDRSRRGSRQSIASSHSGHGGYLQPNAASPFAPGSAPISAAASPNIGFSDLTDLGDGLAILGQSDGTSNPTCSSNTKGCTCLNLDGTLKASGERCALENCPCCARANFSAIGISSLFGGNSNTSSSTFAISTERDAGPMGGASVNSNVTSSLGIGYAQNLQIPLPGNRSRSSSQSSNISTTSFSSLTNGMSGMDISLGGAGAAALNRANSTGQIGRNSKYKNIAPRPAHHNTEPVTSRAGPLQQTQNGASGLASSSQQPFSFPRTSAGGLGAQHSPAVIVTQPQPSDNTVLDQLFQGTLDGSSNSVFGGGSNSNSNFGSGSLNQNQPFSPKQMFDFSNPSAISTSPSDNRHSRNYSHPTNLQTMGTSVSGPPSPHPRSPVHFGDASGSGSGPASPLLQHPSSPGPNSPLLTQPPSPSSHQTPPMITISHGRSQSSSNAGLLEPRPMHYSHHSSGHGRSASTSLLDPLGRSNSFPSVIITPASPHPGSSSSTSGQQQ